MSDSRPVSAADAGPVIGGQLRAPRRWERLLVEAAVIGGRRRWRRRIEGLAKDLRMKFAEKLSEEDEARAAIVKRTAEDLEAFAAYALPLIDALEALPKSANWGEWLNNSGTLATRGRGNRNERTRNHFVPIHLNRSPVKMVLPNSGARHYTIGVPRRAL